MRSQTSPPFSCGSSASILFIDASSFGHPSYESHKPHQPLNGLQPAKGSDEGHNCSSQLHLSALCGRVFPFPVATGGASVPSSFSLSRSLNISPSVRVDDAPALRRISLFARKQMRNPVMSLAVKSSALSVPLLCADR